MSGLEHRYGRLLRAYPKSYRHERGAEILGTLLEGSPPGRRHPGIRDVFDIGLRGGQMRMALGAEHLVRRVRGDLGATVAAIASATVVVSFFLPWYVAPFDASGHTGAVRVSALNAGGGRFFVLALAAAIAVTGFLGPRVRALAVSFALVLLYATWICQANSPAITTAGSYDGGLIEGVGAHLGVASAYVALVGSALHMARPGVARVTSASES
jgi:hypothetical protein